MSYDRMWITHRGTGKQLLVAKSGDGCNWRAKEHGTPPGTIVADTLARRLEAFLEEVADECNFDEELFKDFSVEFERKVD